MLWSNYSIPIISLSSKLSLESQALLSTVKLIYVETYQTSAGWLVRPIESKKGSSIALQSAFDR